MIQVTSWIVILTEQALIMLLVLTVVFFYRIRKLNKQVAYLTGVNGELKKSSLPPTTPPHIAELVEKVALYEQSLRNLEKFRDLFFDMKRKYDSYDKLQQNMIEQTKEAIDHTGGSPPLTGLFEKLVAEKRQLETHLQQIEAELDVLMQNSESGENSVDAGENITGMHELLGEQQAEIQQLKQYVVDLTLEAAIKDGIDNSLENLDQKNNELVAALEILQDENQFLVDKVQTLLAMEVGIKNTESEKITTLEHDLHELEQEHAQLKAKFIALETEYLHICDKK